ncbi:hypothetical protein MIMGU_mgv11b003028mg [Erythranthe guttata]|uniref:Las1-like family protein n=1 Tax=Erythranthe guttata TaxID=4155 RepID=A0A022REZ1_ERYGU|nr:hypothetical protein MIMGU_mgv11b003028mg [Erythranthe guttata]
MEFLSGLKDNVQYDVVEEKSHSLRYVPWMNWDEWKFVKDSLFSASSSSVASALRIISTWQIRGGIHVAIEVTASLVEIQQRDPFFRNDLDERACLSEEMLAMLYTMAIIRLVNGVLEKTRKKNEVSIGEAADAIGIPRMLIDIRHEGSHRDPPSLIVVRLASQKAIDWLISYYWEPQEKEIPIQTNQTSNLRKEIKRRLREVSLCLKAKQTASSSHVNAKLIYLLLEYLLNALENSVDSQIVHDSDNKQTAFDDWKSVVLKLSRKEPELLLLLTQAVLEKMETSNTINNEIDDHQSPDNSTKPHRNELLPCLFEWLVQNLKTSYPVSKKKESAEIKSSKTEKYLPKETVLGLVRRCLLLSYPGKNRLMSSAVTLAQLSGDATLLQKLKKFAILEQLSISEANTEISCTETLFSEQEYSIRKAEEKFELMMRQHRMQKKNEKPNLSESRWSVIKSWNSCPMGMLPHSVGFSGRFSSVGLIDDVCEEVVTSSDNKGDCVVNNLGKREAEICTAEMDDTRVKRLEIVAEDCVMQDQDDVSEEEGTKGCLVIDGVWKKVGEEELSAIASAIRVLV